MPEWDIHTQKEWTDELGKRWRRNGRTKTWKTRPGEFRIPVKHGLRSYGYITEYNFDKMVAL